MRSRPCVLTAQAGSASARAGLDAYGVSDPSALHAPGSRGTAEPEDARPASTTDEHRLAVVEVQLSQDQRQHDDHDDHLDQPGAHDDGRHRRAAPTSAVRSIETTVVPREDQREADPDERAPDARPSPATSAPDADAEHREDARAARACRAARGRKTASAAAASGGGAVLGVGLGHASAPPRARVGGPAAQRVRGSGRCATTTPTPSVTSSGGRGRAPRPARRRRTRTRAVHRYMITTARRCEWPSCEQPVVQVHAVGVERGLAGADPADDREPHVEQREQRAPRAAAGSAGTPGTAAAASTASGSICPVTTMAAAAIMRPSSIDAGVAHEDARRVEVVRQEPQARPDEHRDHERSRGCE